MQTYSMRPALRLAARSGTGKVRDSQRQKVYDAEGVLDGGKNFMSIADCQAYVDAILKERWFQARWATKFVKVQIKPYGNATGNPGRQQINLPMWARCERIIVHELAHIICPTQYAWHGPEYCAIYLTLVEFIFGKEVARRLRESFVKHRVKYRAGARAVPEPKRPVLTQKAVAENKRLRESLPLSAMEKKQAAEILRRAIRLNMVGAAGTKQRSYALLIARTLGGQ